MTKSFYHQHLMTKNSSSFHQSLPERLQRLLRYQIMFNQHEPFPPARHIHKQKAHACIRKKHLFMIAWGSLCQQITQKHFSHPLLRALCVQLHMQIVVELEKIMQLGIQTKTSYNLCMLFVRRCDASSRSKHHTTPQICREYINVQFSLTFLFIFSIIIPRQANPYVTKLTACNL